jgi:hypothetical protein
MEMVKNFTRGLPRFRIPINLDHGKNAGKVGTIRNIQYLPNGPQGPGIYATEYEFSARGLEAIEENGYDAVSAEVVWTVGGKVGGMYQDPETGEEHDNVLVGMALTPTPFFGHGSVALFSAKEQDTTESETPEGGAKSVEESIQEWKNLSEAIVEMTDKIRSAVYSEDNLAQEETMSEENQVVEELVEEMVEETPEIEDTSVQLSPEEFDALKAKADLADEHEAKLAELEEERKAQEAEQRATALRGVAESYTALPVEIDEFVAKMSILEETDEEAAEWFKTQFAAFDSALVEAGLLDEHGTDEERDEDPGLAFLQIVDKTLKEEFEGDPGRYAEALLKASADHPELAQYA